MAVAVKNTPETTRSSALDRLPVASLVGTVYVLLGLGVAFYGIPSLWHAYLSPKFGAELALIDNGLLSATSIVVAAALAFLGIRLLGTEAPKGVRAGIFVGVVGILLIAFLAIGVGFLLENWIYTHKIFGETGGMWGGIITAVFGIALLILAGRYFFRPSFERVLIAMEEQGWFSAVSYKRNQGLRVRRGTILGILLLIGCGLYIMVEHKVLVGLKAPPSMGAEAKVGAAEQMPPLFVSIPFTGVVRITPENVGDWTAMKGKLPREGLALNRFVFRDEKAAFERSHVKIDNPGSSDPDLVNQFSLRKDLIVERDNFEQAVKLAQAKMVTEPTEQPLTLPADEPIYQPVTLLPAAMLTLPLLLGVLAIWFAWRVVNFPAFADFLIATEAEMNKVSWTTWRRLVQDTIVVLVTVVIMAVFLLVADSAWGWTLQKIGVLQIPKSSVEQKDKLKW